MVKLPWVSRSTMERAVADERAGASIDLQTIAMRYGSALERVTALQEQLAAWVMNKTDAISPEQMAQMFYAQDDRWQAAFFNALQGQISAHHDSLPPPRYGEVRFGPGVPPGEGQWWHMAQHLDESGFETIEAMFDHAKHHRDKRDEAATPLESEPGRSSIMV